MRYEDFQLHGTCQLHGSWHVRVIVNYVGLLFMCSVLSFMKLSVMLIDEIGSRSLSHVVKICTLVLLVSCIALVLQFALSKPS